MCRISSSPKETVSRALGLGNRKSCKNSTGEFTRTRSGEKRRGLSAHSPSPRARHPNPRSWPHERPRFHRVTCMRKPQALNALTVWVFACDEMRARQLTAAKLHGTSPRGEQSSTEAVAEVQMDDRSR